MQSLCILHSVYVCVQTSQCYYYECRGKVQPSISAAGVKEAPPSNKKSQSLKTNDSLAEGLCTEFCEILANLCSGTVAGAKGIFLNIYLYTIICIQAIG